MGISILLDTHVLLWALMEPDKLSITAKQLIEHTENTLWVSSASIWEIATKYRLGKLPHAQALVQGLEQHLQQLQIEELPISIKHAFLAGSHPAFHRDPFDRMLAAQALLEGIPIITQDTAFQQFQISILW